MSRATGTTRRRRSTQPRTLTLASGKGGVGRSTIAVELARALTRHDQSVLLVEVAPAQSISTLLEQKVVGGAPRFEPGISLHAETRDSGIEGASLLTLDITRPMLASGPAWSSDQLHDGLRRLGRDWTIIDMPGGSSDGTVEAFLTADVPILVTTPEPAALVSATQLLRACVIRSLARHEDQPRATSLIDVVRPTAMGWEFVDLYRGAASDQHRNVLVEACERVSLGLLLNQVRENSENEQASALCHALALKVGTWPRLLGGVHHENRRWFFARKHAPAANHPREESIAGDMEQLARKLVGFDWSQWRTPQSCLPCIDPASDPRGFLDLEAGTGQDIRQRYRRLWEGYRREGGLISNVVETTTRQRAIGMLETAYRKATVEEEEPNATTPMPNADRKRPGRQLRLARMQRGLGLRELSLRTRVGVKHIEAIETMLLRELPTRVYLKAYLAEIAKTLGLDATLIVDDYLAWLDAQ